MGKVTISFVGKALNKKQTEAVGDVFNSREIALTYVASETDLDKNFVTKADWQAKLWEKIEKAETKLKTAKVAPKKLSSDITEPGKHTIEVEVDADTTLKAKLNITREKGDKSSPVIKPNSNPKSIKLESKANLKAYTGAPDDIKDLGDKMKKASSYSYAGKTLNGWRPSFDGHGCHEDSGTKGWKAYIDEPSMGTGTVWRLYFNTSFDPDSQVLTVTLTDCKRDH